MKLSEKWLREWITTDLTREELGAKLTMAGLEMEAILPVGGSLAHVVIGHILEVNKHPEADRLNVCLVDVGQAEPLTIVCGAKNVRVGMKVPTALSGAVLPNDIRIVSSKIRNVVSNGMLCSARELGIPEEVDGILECPANAPIGQAISDYLHLPDYVMDIGITPNRSDCLSVMGLANEISVVTDAQIVTHAVPHAPSSLSDALSIVNELPEECPQYVGRIIKNIQSDALTPAWMQQRLQRSGIRCISPVVDITNYVMLELGQPMHAFDLQTIDGEIHIRKAFASESLTLLDGTVASLTQDTMVIADKKQPLAIAGIMGGVASSVTLLTKDIFLESAYFNAKSIAQSCRHYGLDSESSYRFQRGIDPTLQVKAIERATQLLLEMVGGQAGPVTTMTYDSHLPKPKSILLRLEKMNKLLGISMSVEQVERFLNRLTLTYEVLPDGWSVTVPAHRFDLVLDVDLMEEIIRLYGYDNLPPRATVTTLQIQKSAASHDPVDWHSVLCDLGYHEVITYSFIDKTLQELFDPENKPKELLNPITADMSVMRTNLWPGLVNAFLYNQNRQQTRVRLFEIGLRFIQRDNTVLQQRVLSGLASGSVYPKQWGMPERAVDFFDVKGDLENVGKLLSCEFESFLFKPGKYPALHPGQTSDIYQKKDLVGCIGVLHPMVMQALGITQNVVLFEILLDELAILRHSHYSELSKFPEIRRDIAILIDRAIPSQSIQDTIEEVSGELLKNVAIFDIYQGKGIAPHQKSIALTLTLQHNSRTLIDEEVAEIIQRVILALNDKFAAELRGYDYGTNEGRYCKPSV